MCNIASESFILFSFLFIRVSGVGLQDSEVGSHPSLVIRSEIDGNSRKLPEMLYAAAFSPDGKYIAAGGCGTNEGKLFDTEDFGV